MKCSRSEFLQIRGLRYHLRHWGAEDAPTVFMLHGWMDVSASFQFVVDCLQRDWHVIAPDWRGFGVTEWPATDAYWFPDYLADLDAILQHYSPEEPVNLLGHSMGGNIACLYAGIRPERVARLINLEGFGMPKTRPEQAPDRYAAWLEALREPPTLHGYATRDQVIMRLKKNNPRLTDERAKFLASHWAAENDDGRWHVLGHAVHKRPSPILYRAEEALACWRRIAAPVLWIEAAQTDIWKWLGKEQEMRAEIDRRIAQIRSVNVEVVSDAGHMLHHDQPERLALLIEAHLTT